jgi:Bacterial archaeo-eukaryotic release factor family 10
MAQDLRQTMNSVADYPGPMFSAYLSVNPAVPENQGQAYLVRLRDAMNDHGVPEELQKRIRGHVEGERHPRARTLALFAAEDDLFEVYRLPVDLPESFRWGDSYVAPLVLALDEYEPYGVALLDAERFRYFVTSPVAPPPGSAEYIGASGYREVDLHPNRPYPRGGGSTDMDAAGRKQEANVHRFYKELGELTRRLTFQEGVKHLILAGPKERTSEFRYLLPKEVQELVVSEEHVNMGESEGKILDSLEEVRERSEREREGRILAQVRESGVSGLDETLAALQEENRVYYLMALWDLAGEIRWCDNDRLAIRDITAEECPFCGQKTRVRPLIDVLVDVAAVRGARLNFIRGENENADTLREEFGGLAGLTRF